MVGDSEELQSSKWFAHFFVQLSGFEPYPWQTVLFCELLENRNPEELCLPTGLGKTAVMHVWLLALSWELIHRPRKQAVPRRLVWVVDRRVVVDQATEVAELLARRIKDAPEIEGALERLSVAGKEDNVLAVSTLRGERADNRAWSLDPSRPAIIVGTVDMIGSRMLFSGYGDGPWYRPQHAGLLGQDVLLVNDEAHLTPAFAKLLFKISTVQHSQGLKPFLTMRLSATPRGSGPRWPDSLTSDLTGSPHFRRIYTAEKLLQFCFVEKREPIAHEILKIAAGANQGRILIFVREPENAASLARAIRKGTGSDRVCLITGTMRGWERDRIVEDPIFRLFASNQSPAEPCWLVATSAAEVGADISSDLLITDLDTTDHLIQRFGRLNRFGETRGQAHLVYHEPDGQKEPRLLATLEYLTGLPALDSGRDISLRSLFENPPPSKACSEEPPTAQFSARVFDTWSQTSLCPHPARPPVEAWLHGKQEDLPETEIAWRDDVSWLASRDVSSTDRREALRRHRVLAHERLREPTSRVWKKLQFLPAETHILLLHADGAIGSFPIHALVADPARLRYSLILLPTGCGSIEDGMFQPHAPAEPTPDYDVADRPAGARRARFLAQFDGEGWLIRPLGISPGAAKPKPIWLGSLDQGSVALFARNLGLDLSWQVQIANAEEGEIPRAALLYFRQPKSKKRTLTEVLLDDHLQAVADMARRLAEKLQLPPDLAQTFQWAGRLHDLGKAAPIWQSAMGGDPARPLAKTAGPGSPAQLAGFRHELASLTSVKAILDVPLALRDLALHLVAAHHGWARPHFPDRALDRRNLRASQAEALECARRFARLQEVYGYWGLAYLEAMFKAADAMVSADGYEQPDYA